MPGFCTEYGERSTNLAVGLVGDCILSGSMSTTNKRYLAYNVLRPVLRTQNSVLSTLYTQSFQHQFAHRSINVRSLHLDWYEVLDSLSILTPPRHSSKNKVPFNLEQPCPSRTASLVCPRRSSSPFRARPPSLVSLTLLSPAPRANKYPNPSLNLHSPSFLSSSYHISACTPSAAAIQSRVLDPFPFDTISSFVCCDTHPLEIPLFLIIQNGRGTETHR